MLPDVSMTRAMSRGETVSSGGLAGVDSSAMKVPSPSYRNGSRSRRTGSSPVAISSVTSNAVHRCQPWYVPVSVWAPPRVTASVW